MPLVLIYLQTLVILHLSHEQDLTFAPYFSTSCEQKIDIPQFDAVCKVVQLCCRVRGYKHVMKLFPHEVSHLELCLLLLRAQVRISDMIR